MGILVYVGLGSNLGDARANVERGAALLGDTPGIQVLRRSALFETEPWRADPNALTQPWFVNAVVEARTPLGPQELLEALLRIEHAQGRDRSREVVVGAPRALDLDLLFYGAAVLEEPGLVLPHPRAHERRFVLEPLCALNPALVHPKLRRRADELLAALDDPCAVRPLA